MRTPTWEASPGALAALLAARGPLNKADVYTVTLAGGGTVLRWSGHDTALTLGSTFYALGPGIQRNRVRFVVGVEVSTLELTLIDIIGTTINGQGLMAFVARRGLYGAQVRLDRVFWGVGDAGPVGALGWFTGRVGGAEIERHGARISIVSAMEMLDTMVPGEVYQPGCSNQLYDTRCGVSRAARTVSATASAASNAQRTTFGHTLPQAVGYFDLGAVTFTSGPNAGISRTIKAHAAGTIEVLSPWPFAVAAGNAFQIVPGCNRSRTDANGCPKFYSAADVELRFRGHPFVPVPETVL
jgi:uncharacterized phage protein (TIGR02218 family)